MAQTPMAKDPFSEIKTITFEKQQTINASTGTAISLVQTGTNYDLTKCIFLGVESATVGNNYIVLRSFNGSSQSMGVRNFDSSAQTANAAMSIRYIVPSNA